MVVADRVRLLLRSSPLRMLCSEAAASSMSSSTSSSSSSSSSKLWEGVEGEKRWSDSLGRRLLRLKYPNRSAVVTIHKWLHNGNNTIHKHHLFRIVRQLREAKRHKHALEVCEWLTTRTDFRLQPGDYAIHLDLIAKVRGLASAEKFFDDLPKQMKSHSTYNSLLHAFVQNNVLSKAESVMNEMAARGFLTSCAPFNHMINLYLTSGLLDKIPKMMEELKKNALPDTMTYNLLLTACSANVDLKGAEELFVEMHERNLSADWITYSILAKLYIANGMPGRARRTLKEMEALVSKEERKAYCSLLTLHASVFDEDDVNRIWDDMKLTFKKMTDAEYSSMIACLVKVGDLERAESVFGEWESVSETRKMKVPNILVSGYIQRGMMDKAKSFIERTNEKGIRPNYSTWEIMAWGYLGQNKMDEVLCCMRKALESLKKWKPDDQIVKSVFDKVELSGNIEIAEQFLVMFRKAGYVTTAIYNSLLRTYEKAGKMPLIIQERMKTDNVEPDDETKSLLESTSRLCAGQVSSLVS